jgi:hypothetical protein
MKRLAEIYREPYAKHMTGVSHVPGAPWHTVYEVNPTSRRFPFPLGSGQRRRRQSRVHATVELDALSVGARARRAAFGVAGHVAGHAHR